MRIAVDIDGPISNFAEECNAWMAFYLGVYQAPILQYYWAEAAYGDIKGRQAWDAFWEYVRIHPEWWLKLEANARAARIMDNWRQLGHDVYLLTARPVDTRSTTRSWLDMNGFARFPLEFAKDKNQHEWDLLIDDWEDHCEAAVRESRKAVLYGCEWNEREAGIDYGYARAADWEQIDLIVLYEAKRSDLPDGFSPSDWPPAYLGGGEWAGKVVPNGPLQEPTHFDQIDQIIEGDAQAFMANMDAAETRIVDADTGGMKGQKDVQYSLLPVEAMNQVARVYEMGARKYDRNNWRKGYDWNLAYDAAMRHLTAFWGGEDMDPESGLPHPAHVVFHMLTLMTFMDTHPNKDNRHVEM